MGIYQSVGNFTESESMSKNITDITPLVSIIVPIYNVEQYVNRCVDSILAQTYSNIEVILIDDGSADKSRERISVYNNDPRCKVVYKDNGGASSARNVGISLASGEYIYFIDADDYIDKCEIERMMDIALKFNADMVVCDYILEYKKNKFVYQKGMKDACDAFDFLKQIYNGIFIGTL